MKSLFIVLLLVITSIGYAQDNYIVTTDDGRRVLLKADYTWEYIDAKTENKVSEGKSIEAAMAEAGTTNNCDVSEDFEEPKLNKKIQSELKRGRASIDYVKEKVAKDNNCGVDQVLLLSANEHKSKAVYLFCANGKRTKYKRVGTSIIKTGSFF